VKEGIKQFEVKAPHYHWLI